MTTSLAPSRDPTCFSYPVTMNQYWYIAIVRDKRLVPVAGPFPTRGQADAISTKAKRLAYDIAPFTWFDHWATIRTATGKHRGILNDRLGI